jgi:hypothetical protein
MTTTIRPVDVLDYYDREVTREIHEKYGLDWMESLRRFTRSQTYAMLADPALEMWEFSPLAIFDLWETEQVTGDPRDSVYLKDDDRD